MSSQRDARPVTFTRAPVPRPSPSLLGAHRITSSALRTVPFPLVRARLPLPFPAGRARARRVDPRVRVSDATGRRRAPPSACRVPPVRTRSRPSPPPAARTPPSARNYRRTKIARGLVPTRLVRRPTVNAHTPSVRPTTSPTIAAATRSDARAVASRHLRKRFRRSGFGAGTRIPTLTRNRALHGPQCGRITVPGVSRLRYALPNAHPPGFTLSSSSSPPPPPPVAPSVEPVPVEPVPVEPVPRRRAGSKASNESSSPLLAREDGGP